MSKQELATQLTVLQKKYNSTYARREVLKLKKLNRDEDLIGRKNLELSQLQDEIADLSKQLLLL